MNQKAWQTAAALCSVLAVGTAITATPSPKGATEYIISPADGATVSNPFTVRFGLAVMGVAPAGVDVAGTGHHHLLIDVAEPPKPGVPYPRTRSTAISAADKPRSA